MAKKIHPFASVWYKIGVFWPNIKPVKSPTTALDFKLQTGMNQIFQMRYCASLWVKGLQKYLRSTLEVAKKITNSANSNPMRPMNRLNRQIFYRPLTLTFDIFVASWPTRMHSTSFERSDSYLFGAWSPRLWYDFEHILCWVKVPLFHIIQRQMAVSFLPRVYLLLKKLLQATFCDLTKCKYVIYSGSPCP